MLTKAWFVGNSDSLLGGSLAFFFGGGGVVGTLGGASIPAPSSLNDEPLYIIPSLYLAVIYANSKQLPAYSRWEITSHIGVKIALTVRPW